MASKKLIDYWEMEGHLQTAEKVNNREIFYHQANKICRMLDRFWLNHCEKTKKILGLVSYTSHDHVAKGMWADVDHRLRDLINERGSCNES